MLPLATAVVGASEGLRATHMTGADKGANAARPAAIRRLLQKAGLDQAVVFTLLTKAWQAAAGAVTLLLIATYFAPDVQGYYYTFSSLLALQAFVELGLYIVIVNLASREWGKLRITDTGIVAGDAAALSRLASLIRFVAKWYTGVSVLFVLGVGVAGYTFFLYSHPSEIAWRAPWLTVVVLAAAQLWLMPMLSLLEGCNQVVELNRFRLAQSIVETFTMWGMFTAGAGLWVAVGSIAARVLATLIFLGTKYSSFIRSLMADAGRESIHWKDEVWPMQWRLAAQGMVNYLALSLFNPLMFHYHGAKVAGQMGMTLQIIGVVQAMALAWVQTKVPQFGMLAAGRNFAELDRIWMRASKLSFAFTVAGSLVLWTAILVLGEMETGLETRILGPLPAGLFFIAYAVLQVSSYQAAYLRAHGREPFLALGVFGGLLIGALVFALGSAYGPIGAAAGFLGAVGVFVVPTSTLIWKRCRTEWQA
jgi:hypothetical protein